MTRCAGHVTFLKSKRRCRRSAQPGEVFCYQHGYEVEFIGNFRKWDRIKFAKPLNFKEGDKLRTTYRSDGTATVEVLRRKKISVEQFLQSIPVKTASEEEIDNALRQAEKK